MHDELRRTLAAVLTPEQLHVFEAMRRLQPPGHGPRPAERTYPHD